MFGLHKSSFGDESLAEVLIPDPPGFFLSIEIMVEFQDNCFSVDTTRDFKSSRELRIHATIYRGLGVGCDIVYLLRVPPKSHDEGKEKSFSHPGAIESKTSLLFLNLTGKNIAFTYQCPYPWEYMETFWDF